MTRTTLRRTSRVFVATSAFFAVANRRDSSCKPASAVMECLVAERRRLVTTTFVLAERHALLLARFVRGVAARVLAAVDAGQLMTHVRVSARDERRARELVFRHADNDFSLTDATCFAVMERLCIVEACTFDKTIARFDWPILPAARR